MCEQLDENLKTTTTIGWLHEPALSTCAVSGKVWMNKCDGSQAVHFAYEMEFSMEELQ